MTRSNDVAITVTTLGTGAPVLDPNKFSQINLMAPSKHHMPELGLTLDEINDYKFINTIITRLHSKKKAFSLDDILTFLMTNKKYLKINKNVKRKVVKVK